MERMRGYSWEESLDYGVNWAYMQNRAENSDPLTIVVLCSAFVIILLAGYLIIYNIFLYFCISGYPFLWIAKNSGNDKETDQKYDTQAGSDFVGSGNSHWTCIRICGVRSYFSFCNGNDSLYRSGILK
mgnify:FL=1